MEALSSQFLAFPSAQTPGTLQQGWRTWQPNLPSCKPLQSCLGTVVASRCLGSCCCQPKESSLPTGSGEGCSEWKCYTVPSAVPFPRLLNKVQCSFAPKIFSLSGCATWKGIDFRVTCCAVSGLDEFVLVQSRHNPRASLPLSSGVLLLRVTGEEELKQHSCSTHQSWVDAASSCL